MIRNIIQVKFLKHLILLFKNILRLFNFELAPSKPKQDLFVFVGELVESLVNVKIMFDNHPKKSHLRVFSEVRVSSLINFILEIIDLC